MTILTRHELLVLLIEECGEVIQAATKVLRFGYDVDHGTGYGNNRDQLAKEMGELTAVRDALELDCGPCQNPFMEGWAHKIRRAEDAKIMFGQSALAGESGRAAPEAQPVALRDALELARNVLAGEATLAARKRDYARADGYDGHAQLVDAALAACPAHIKGVGNDDAGAM